MAAGRPYKITATENPSDLANQLNRELGRIGRDFATLSSQVAKGSTTAAAVTPTIPPALAAVKAEVAAIKGLLRPMTVLGGAIASGSVLTSQLGISATTGAPVWAVSTPIAAGQQIRPTGAPANGNFFFQATGSGTTGATEPVWQTEDGAATDDNNVLWVQSGLAANTPIGSSSFADVVITPLSLPNNTWEQLATVTLYMGDINGPMLIGLTLPNTSFSAGQTLDIDVVVQVPTLFGTASTESAARITFAIADLSGFPSGVFSMVGSPKMYALMSALGNTPIPGNVTVTVYAKQNTGGGQSIVVGGVYVALQHS